MNKETKEQGPESSSQKLSTKHRPFLIGLVVFIIIIVMLALIGSGTENPNPEPKAQGDEEHIVEQSVFDVPSLLGKNIDEVQDVLGSPTLYFEPKENQLINGEWDMTFKKDNFDLFVTYDYNTKIVKDFFVSANDEIYENRDKDQMMRITNTRKRDDRYSVSFIPAMQDASRFTGILITPK
jgi:hypothetical protein